MSIHTLGLIEDFDLIAATIVGGSSAFAVWNDSSTATYVEFDAGSLNDVRVGPDNWEIPAGQRVAAVRIVVQFDSVAPTDFFTNFFNNAQQSSLLNHYVVTVSGAPVLAGRWITERPGGGEWTIEAVQSMQFRLWDANRNPGKPKIYKVYGEADVRSQPTSAVVGPTGVVDSRHPIIDWTFNGIDGEPQSDFQVKIFTTEQVGFVGFDPDTASAVVDSGSIHSPLTQWQVPTEMGDGTYQAFVNAAKSFRGEPWFSGWSDAGPTFEVDSTPATPTGVGPTGSVNTDIPILTATVTAQSLGLTSRIRWQIAKDAGFTDSLREYTEPITKLRASGATSAQLPVASQLSQGGWYIRAAQVDESGIQGSWSGAGMLNVSHPPVAINRLPNGTTVRYGTGKIEFTWDFSDTSPVDYQTALQVAVRRVGDAAVVLNSGKLLSSAGRYIGAIDPGFKDANLEWQVTVWDSDDVAGAVSAWTPFITSDDPVITIVTPADGAVVASNAPTIDWTVTASLGRTQVQKQVVFTRLKDNVVDHDSGLLTSAVTDYTPGSPALKNNTDYLVTVQIIDSAGLSGKSVISIQTGYAGATAPDYTVDIANFDTNGYVTISWDDTDKDVDWSAWRVYRKRYGDTYWTLAYETTDDLSSYDFQDWLAGGVSWYVVAQVAFRAGIEQESLFPSPASVEPYTESYWLIHPIDPAQTRKLNQVKSDSFSLEYEEAEIQLIGRGRHIDYGDKVGYQGSITCSLYDLPTETARQQRLALEALKHQRIGLYLRSPFGDVWYVNAGLLSFERMPGVGTREFGTVTIPYTQVEGAAV